MTNNKALMTGLFAALLLVSGSAAFAQAKLTDFVGKVEIKPPKAGWTPARKGMAVASGSIVSTGFRSKATIELDQSTLFVNQLTRLSLEELVRKQNVITTNIYIRAGSLEADVKTGGADYTHDFKVKSPVSTAAVRGTRITDDGYEMTVKEGKAVLYNLLNQPMTVFKDDYALTGTGLDLMPSGRLRNSRFRLPRRFHPASGHGAAHDSTYTSDAAIVIFYTIW
ncbi:MAG: FecR domain-containing protein [Spirochaetales bacterium]|nr:FecR domain-containing protein [Spirochaetales bacterium]